MKKRRVRAAKIVESGQVAMKDALDLDEHEKVLRCIHREVPVFQG